MRKKSLRILATVLSVIMAVTSLPANGFFAGDVDVVSEDTGAESYDGGGSPAELSDNDVIPVATDSESAEVTYSSERVTGETNDLNPSSQDNQEIVPLETTAHNESGFEEMVSETPRFDGDDEMLVDEEGLLHQEMAEDVDDFEEIREFIEDDDLDEVVKEEEMELGDGAQASYKVDVSYGRSTNIFVRGESVVLTASVSEVNENGGQVDDEAWDYSWTVYSIDTFNNRELIPSANYSTVGLSMTPVEEKANQIILATTSDTELNNICVSVTVSEGETEIASSQDTFISFAEELYVMNCTPEDWYEDLELNTPVSFTATVQRRSFDNNEGKVTDVPLANYDDWGISLYFDPSAIQVSYADSKSETIKVKPARNEDGSNFWWSNGSEGIQKRRDCGGYVIPCGTEFSLTKVDSEGDLNFILLGVKYTQIPGPENTEEQKWMVQCSDFPNLYSTGQDDNGDDDNGNQLYFGFPFQEGEELPVHSSWDIPARVEGTYPNIENNAQGVTATFKNLSIDGMWTDEEGEVPADPDQPVISFDPNDMTVSVENIGYAEVSITYTIPQYTDMDGVNHDEEDYQYKAFISAVESLYVIEVELTTENGRMLPFETYTLKAWLTRDWYDEDWEEHVDYLNDCDFRVKGIRTYENELTNAIEVISSSYESNPENGGRIFNLQLTYNGSGILDDNTEYLVMLEAFDEDKEITYEIRPYPIQVTNGYYAITKEEFPRQFPVGEEVSLEGVDVGLKYVYADYVEEEQNWVRAERTIAPSDYQDEKVRVYYDWNPRQLYAVTGRRSKLDSPVPVLKRFTPNGSEIWAYVVKEDNNGDYYEVAQRPYNIPTIEAEDMLDDLSLLNSLGETITAMGNKTIQGDNLELLDECLNWSSMEDHLAAINKYAEQNDPWLITAAGELDNYYGGMTLSTAPDPEDIEENFAEGNLEAAPVCQITIANETVPEAIEEKGYSVAISGAAPTAAYYASSDIMDALEGKIGIFAEEAVWTYRPVADINLPENSESVAQTHMDISLNIACDNGTSISAYETVEPVTAVSVSLAVPENYCDKQRFVLVHELEDGTEEEVDYNLNGQNLSFAVPSLSPFRLVDRTLFGAEQLIGELSGDEDVEEKASVEAARAAYNGLGELKDEVNSELVALLLAAEKSVADHEAASSVDAELATLTGDSSKVAVEKARKAYDSLSADQKNLVKNYAKLTAAEDVLKKAEAATSKSEDKPQDDGQQAKAEAEAREKEEVIARFKLNVANGATVPLKVKQTSKKVTMVDHADGDSLASAVSNNSKVATATVSGSHVVLKGKKKGKAKITVTSSMGGTIVFYVKVQKAAVKTKSISVRDGKSSITLKKGKSYNLGTVINPITSQDKIKYSSSRKKVATVTGKGLIKAKGIGKAVITIKAGKKTKRISVTVTK